MTIASVTQTCLAPPQPPTGSAAASGPTSGAFQLASASGTQAVSAGSTNPYSALSADLQNTLLSLQQDGSAAGSATQGTQTDGTAGGQTLAHAHHRHGQHHAASVPAA